MNKKNDRDIKPTFDDDETQKQEIEPGPTPVKVEEAEQVARKALRREELKREH